MVVYNQELLISQGEFNMLRLYIRHWDGCSDYLLSSHCVENAEPECCSRRKDILGVLSDIHGLNGLFDREDTDTSAIVCIVHANVSIIGAGEEKVAIEVVHDFPDWTRVTRQVDRLHLCLIL